MIDSSLIDPSDRDRALGLLSGTIASTYHKGDAQSEAYRVLLLSACNQIGKSLPFLFKQIKDWMELLLPDDLLGEHGILAMIREVMTEDACQDVEVIGWLYQYYISEKKDEVFANVKKGKKVQSAEIPAVTQLFTPHWIVKYMVQNSLGRLWLESHPKSSLKAKMEYYVQADAVPPTDKTDSIQKGASASACTPEEIKFCDPCCGSGHILTYAFDLLYEIYSEEGYDPIDIPRLIIAKNLYGIEIDERASELAAFALAMKARDKDRQWFSRGIDPQICCLENISFTNDEIEPYLDKCGRDIFTLNFERMLSQFEHADTFGSLIVPFEEDMEGIRELLNAIDFSGDVFLAPTHKKVLKLIDQADYLSTKYQVVVTNPPYLGTSGFGKEKEDWFKSSYPNSRSDFFAMFMERCLSLSVQQGHIAMINMQSWMFLKSYENLRIHLLKNYRVVTMAHLGPHAFDSIGGEVVSTTSFVLQNTHSDGRKGTYFDLVDGTSEEAKRKLYLDSLTNPNSDRKYRRLASDFIKIPRAPVIYLASNGFRSLFNGTTLGKSAKIIKGLDTCDNERFLRYWFEICRNRAFIDIDSSYVDHDKKWFSYCKGGDWRKWYGNYEYVVNWMDNGRELKNFKNTDGTSKSRVQNVTYYFREGITYSSLGSKTLACRLMKGSIFGGGGSGVFTKDNLFVISLLNSKISAFTMKLLNPSMNFLVDDLERLPIVDIVVFHHDLKTETIVKITKEDWDSSETSWDFQQLPLLGVRCQGLGIRECYAKLREQWIESTLKMQELEEENNRIFIEAYGLEDEIKPEVPLREITLTCNPYYRYQVSGDRCQGVDVREFPINEDLEKRLLADTMKELISYAVGCMFGRYSLDKPGLILANQGEGLDDYVVKVLGVSGLGVRDSGSGEAALKPNTQNLKPSFMPDKDNVIPILEGEWFVDDIVSRFADFLKVAFGTEKYSENISFIEEALGKDLRAYFLKDFYNDHLKRYKKRPIYWLFSSPKGSFNALIYMHRYTPDTVSILLNGYLREYIHKLRAKVSQLEHQLNAGDQSERDKMLTRKEIDRLKEVVSELELWDAKVLLPLAEKRIEIDLDDGVKVNYGKFGEALKRC
jgi:type II restriction/modification system DNA methylase subunit YeeA